MIENAFSDWAWYHNFYHIYSPKVFSRLSREFFEKKAFSIRMDALLFLHILNCNLIYLTQYAKNKGAKKESS